MQALEQLRVSGPSDIDQIKAVAFKLCLSEGIS